VVAGAGLDPDENNLLPSHPTARIAPLGSFASELALAMASSSEQIVDDNLAG
jgi:hypothetical protein